MAETRKSAKKSVKRKASSGWTAEEKAAARDYARERKAAARRGRAATKEEGEQEVLAKIAEMPDADRELAERLHALITSTAPELVPRTWYGMPAYAKDDKVVCFFQNASKFKSRYATLGFSDKAKLDEGNIWPSSFAVTKLTKADEAKIRALVKKAVS
jgi:hypothetical protein